MTDETKRLYCAVPIVADRAFEPGVDDVRARAIISTGYKWPNGTEISYYQYRRGSWGGSTAARQAVRNGFERWAEIGLGISFREVQTEHSADLRIGFLRGDGSWSYIGTGAKQVRGRTMNFGWDITRDADTVTHEIGHALGLNHEHQNPYAGLEWYENRVYSYFGSPPNNWSRATTYHNVIRKIPPESVKGSNWDSDSIMHYPFGPGLVQEPEEYTSSGIYPAPGISERDADVVRYFYPPEPDEPDTIGPGDSVELDIAPGQSVPLTVEVNEPALHELGTVGDVDTVIYLYDEAGVLMDHDDDSGYQRNAKIKIDLTPGTKYTLRTRLYWQSDSGPTRVYCQKVVDK